MIRYMNYAREHRIWVMATKVHAAWNAPRLVVATCMVAVTAIAMAGCRTAPQRAAAMSPIDRLMSRYPEMRSGRFSVIADFEDENQLELFHVHDASGSAGIEHGPRAGRRRSEPLTNGGNALRFQSASPDDALIVNNDQANNWFLKRDWRDFDLLRLAVDAPRDDLALVVSIRAGKRGTTRVVETRTPLTRGRNELRFDLAELGEHLPLDDVRELRLKLDQLDRPTSIMLDDVFLTRDRETMVGDPTAADASLYVQRIGRRFHVGAAGRFELIFGNGQIVGWHDLAEDPHRLRNLVAGTTLGPMIELGAPGETGTAKLHIAEAIDSTAEVKRFFTDGAAEVRTELVEASAARAVIASAWYFARGENGNRPNRTPDRRWVYTIYPTGDVYVQVQAATAASEAEGVGTVPFALRVALGLGVEDSGSRGTAMDETTGHDVRYASIGISDRSTLAWVPFTQGGMRIEPRSCERGAFGRTNAVLTALGTSRGLKPAARDAPVICTASLFALSHNNQRDVKAMAGAFQTPAAIEPQNGLCRDLEDRCGLSSGCFDRGDGAYHVVADSEVVRFSFDGSLVASLAPAFVIHGSESRAAWVYVNQRLLEPTARDESDRLIFQVAGPLSGPVLVEVLLQPR
jgi:hypothetical protein